MRVVARSTASTSSTPLADVLRRPCARVWAAFVLSVSSLSALGACSGKTESRDGDTGDAAGSGGTRGGTAGSSSGTSGAGGASGSAGGGASGAGGTRPCTSVPVSMLCVRGTPAGENESLATGEPLRIDVMPSGCHSSSCTEAVVATCSITGTGAKLVATGEFCLASTADPGVGCTSDCGGGGYARCESDGPLEAGDYTLSLGDLSVSFSVPGTLSIGQACDGSQF
jgi:hypothetical protein